MKLALVLITLTRTVLVASVRARVKRPHITALKARFIRKKNLHDHQPSSIEALKMSRIRTPRTKTSTIPLGSLKPKMCEMPVVHVVVSCVVVSLAKTPLRAAHAPEAMA